MELHVFIREGLGSRVRLRARGTLRLTNQLRLALEPECLENPQATAREDPQDGADSIKDTQAEMFCRTFQVLSADSGYAH